MKRKIYTVSLNSSSQASDWLGIFSSGLCMAHCLVTPVVVALQLHFSAHQSPHWHEMGYAFLVVSLLACYVTTRRGTSRRLAVWLWSLLGLLAVSVLLHEVADFFEYLTYLATTGLAICHILNIKYCGKCRSEAS